MWAAESQALGLSFTTSQVGSGVAGTWIQHFNMECQHARQWPNLLCHHTLGLVLLSWNPDTQL